MGDSICLRIESSERWIFVCATHFMINNLSINDRISFCFVFGLTENRILYRKFSSYILNLRSPIGMVYGFIWCFCRKTFRSQISVHSVVQRFFNAINKHLPCLCCEWPSDSDEIVHIIIDFIWLCLVHFISFFITDTFQFWNDGNLWRSTYVQLTTKQAVYSGTLISSSSFFLCTYAI